MTRNIGGTADFPGPPVQISVYVVRVFLIGFICLSAARVDAAATFTPLGLFDGTGSRAQDVSADGSVVVGIAYSGNGPFSVFRWTSQGTELRPSSVETAAVSADGSIVVGAFPSPNGQEAFRWTIGGSFQGLGDLAGGEFRSAAVDVSADGNVVVGGGFTAVGVEAFRWTQPTGLVALGDFAGGETVSFATAVSGEGTVVAGYGTGPDSDRQAFRWTSATGMVGLGRLPNAVRSEAHAVSADGSVVVGRNDFRVGLAGVRSEAFRWTASEGMIGLADFQGPVVNTIAFDVSGDGSVIVGRSQVNENSAAFYWTAESGMVNLQDLLVSLGATNLDGWQLVQAEGITPDGITIVGTGLHNGVGEAFVATIPEPSTIVLAALAAAGLVGFWFLKRRSQTQPVGRMVMRHDAPLSSRRKLLRNVIATMAGMGLAYFAPCGKRGESHAAVRRQPHLAHDPQHVADVRDFGAKGDGTTDDAAAIQAAVDSLANTAGVVRLSSGRTYAIGSMIHVIA